MQQSFHLLGERIVVARHFRIIYPVEKASRDISVRVEELFAGGPAWVRGTKSSRGAGIDAVMPRVPITDDGARIVVVNQRIDVRKLPEPDAREEQTPQLGERLARMSFTVKVR